MKFYEDELIPFVADIGGLIAKGGTGHWVEFFNSHTSCTYLTFCTDLIINKNKKIITAHMSLSPLLLLAFIDHLLFCLW